MAVDSQIFEMVYVWGERNGERDLQENERKRGMNLTIIVLICLNVVFNATANILIKTAMNKLAGVKLNSLTVIFSQLILNPVFILGCVSFGMSLLFYSFVLQKVNVSFAYPITVGGSIILVSFVSMLLLHEKIKATQVAGVAVILAGITLIMR